MNFFEEVYLAVAKIPPGSVASYGAVAEAIGRRRGARLVGWALGALKRPSEIPWQRVINRTRRISIVNPIVTPEMQKDLLEREGRVVELRHDGWYVTGTDWYDFSAGKDLV